MKGDLDMNDYPLIPGVRDPLGGPVRDVLGNPIGRSDRYFGVTPDRLIDSTYVRALRGDVVGQVNQLGGILPPPKIGW